MENHQGNVSLDDLSGTVLTVEVKVSRQFHARMWLGRVLLIAAAWVMGCDLDVNFEHDE